MRDFISYLQTGEIHTMLVNIYLDEILSKSDNEQIRFDRDILFFQLLNVFIFLSSAKLQAFIFTSNSYRVQTVLNRINQTNRLQREVALLYGKVNIHQTIRFYYFFQIFR